jgi:hypothetical protein
MKKNEILLPNSYFSINANNRTWFSLYRPTVSFFGEKKTV